MKYLTYLLFIIYSSASFAQVVIDDQSKPSFMNRVYVGGGLGLSGGTDTYGNQYFYYAINPIIGYMITPKFSAGTGLSWQRYTYSQVDLKIDQYGVSPFVRYNFSQLFAYGEYNLFNTPTYYSNVRATYDRLLLGLGYSQPLGRRGSINGMALYDVIYKSSERVFASPWVFRVFFTL
jgi:hypothetical protein